MKNLNVTTHYKGEIIEEHFGDGTGFGVNIHYVSEEHPLGTAGSLSLIGKTDLPMLVINGDVLTRVDFRALLDYHQEHAADMTVATWPYEVQVPYGVVESHQGIITAVTEKPTVRWFINAGIYLLSPGVCEYVPYQQPFSMPELITRLISDGRKVVSFPMHEYWMDIGHHDDYEQAQQDASQGKV